MDDVVTDTEYFRQTYLFTLLTSTWWFPLLYVFGLAIIFNLFAKWNKLRLELNAYKNVQDSYFGRNYEKEVYLELAEVYSPTDPESFKLLCTALMDRAVTCVGRIFRIREEKGPLGQLVKNGGVGEEIYEKVLLEEASTEKEVQEIMEEAEFYKPNWKTTIFNEASQIHQAKNGGHVHGENCKHNDEPENVQESHVHGPDCNHEDEEEDGSNKQDLSEEKRQQLIDSLIEEEEKEKKNKEKRSVVSSDKKKGKKGKKSKK